MAYDEKFRERAVAYKEAGHTFKELKEVFGICNCAYYKWVALKAEYGVYKPEKETNRKTYQGHDGTIEAGCRGEA